MRKQQTVIILSCFLMIITGIVYSISFSNDFLDDRTSMSADEKIELTFWRNYGNSAENKAFEIIVSAFEENYPNITINMQSIQYKDYEKRLRTELAAGNPPDIMMIDSPHLALYVNAGALLSLDLDMRTEGNIVDIPKSTIKGLSINDEIYLAPLVESSVALLYNKHLFHQAGIPLPSSNPHHPLTWNEVLEISRKIRNPSTGIYGIDPVQGFEGGEVAAYFNIPLLWQFGAEILSPDGTTASGYLDSKEALEALQFYQDLYFSPASSVKVPSFESGHLAMKVIGSWALDDFMKNHPHFKLGEDYEIIPMPRSKNQVVSNGGWALGISAKTKYPKEAWQFIRYVTSYEGSRTYVSITGDIPARYSVARAFPEFNGYPKNIFLQQAQLYSRSRPVTPAYSVVSDEIRVLFEEVGQEGMDPGTSVSAAIEKINQALQEISKYHFEHPLDMN
ncbi:ABC transporter substrate-binding protein [Caldalkalibacillus mannanilyticus]|uniref:ABC transporter substrate-binding protein n=1 Tax=Caldalkalibacillus mannanilyticus TaxID=1418 RepID=UPI00046A4B36|nr:sugar ABC transporter substrate-binding protein [Caldalkalibacillus mannanilyticus]